MGLALWPGAVAVRRALADGHAVAHIQLRHIWPLPRNLGDLLANFDHVLLPEMNTGQLADLLSAQLGLAPARLNKVTGQPFQVREIAARIDELLDA